MGKVVVDMAHKELVGMAHTVVEGTLAHREEVVVGKAHMEVVDILAHTVQVVDMSEDMVEHMELGSSYCNSSNFGFELYLQMHLR